MKKNFFDVIVLGLGAHGSAALYHLSKNKKNVCGIDRFMPPHNFGSSHGESRIIRQAYHESPMYVPLVKEAYNLWHGLEQAANTKLLLKTGGIMLGDEDAGVVTGARLSAETHGLYHENLNAGEIKKRYPALKPSEKTIGVFERDAGILFPEKCIKANLELAVKNNAKIFCNEKVISINPNKNSIKLITDKNEYEAEKLIVCAGAWLSSLLPELNLPLKIERQVLYWFRNTEANLQSFLLPDKLPVYIWEYAKEKLFYGFADVGSGLKMAPHHQGKSMEAPLLSQQVEQSEIDNIKSIAGKYINAQLQLNYTTVCMYTNTPDEDFIIDYYPENNNIIIGSPCSGHGFKFSSVIGKILGEMALEQAVQFDLKPFSLQRFKYNKKADLVN